MKNLGMGGRNNTRARARRYGFATISILRWRSELSGKWICVQPLLHFFAGPRIRPEFIEKSHADDSDVLGVAIFLGGIRFANGSETKRRNPLSALSKAFNFQLRLWRHDITGLSHRRFASVQDIESVDRQNNFKAQIRFVPDHDCVTTTLLTDNKPAVADDQPGKEASALVL